ncbi:MAG: hypothetical protein NTX96_00915 [Candidatus Zambryskibacteria bacterium]|nr:hypothetical protein [Candidatus Zambryskibacteria bacterium]
MYQKILNFIKYNNAFTIIFVICFFGFGVTFAANPDAIYSSEETVVSVDNSWIISADLDNYNFNLRINSITEDEKNYYATYSYQTMVIEDSVWQNKEIEKTLTVSKETLDGKDLGLYVAKELGENISYELSYLKRVQKLEKEKGESQKIVTTEYSGLIGKLIDPKQEVIEGYNPVIPEVVPEVPITVKSNPEEVIVSTQYPEPQPGPAPQPTPEPVGTSTPPQIEPTPEPTPEPVATSTPPGDVIDEGLVQEVVQELLQDATSTPATTTPTQ